MTVLLPMPLFIGSVLEHQRDLCIRSTTMGSLFDIFRTIEVFQLVSCELCSVFEIRHYILNLLSLFHLVALCRLFIVLVSLVVQIYQGVLVLLLLLVSLVLNVFIVAWRQFLIICEQWAEARLISIFSALSSLMHSENVTWWSLVVSRWFYGVLLSIQQLHWNGLLLIVV